MSPGSHTCAPADPGSWVAEQLAWERLPDPTLLPTLRGELSPPASITSSQDTLPKEAEATVLCTAPQAPISPTLGAPLGAPASSPGLPPPHQPTTAFLAVPQTLEHSLASRTSCLAFLSTLMAAPSDNGLAPSHLPPISAQRCFYQ